MESNNLKIGDVVQINAPTHKLHNFIGTIDEILSIDVDSIYYRIHFNGVENCKKAGYSIKWSQKYANVGFLCTFQTKNLLLVKSFNKSLDNTIDYDEMEKE